jgi:hypothetical protein
MRLPAAAVLAALPWLAAGCRAPPAPPALPPAPRAAEAQAPAHPVPEAPPLYRPPRIGEVLLRAHVDVEGRLLGPQVMYEVVDPGGWNLGALDAVPAPGAEAAAAPPDPALLDPDAAAGIVLTGLMRPEDGPAAEALAARQGPDWRAAYDAQAGWLLRPAGGR